MRFLPIAVIAVLGLLLVGCGGSEDVHESLAGTPAAINVVKDVEAMARACKKPS
jgi:preprotein translocase subunit Sss1